MIRQRLLPIIIAAMATAVPVHADTLIDCLEGQPIGDALDRGFYVTDFPGAGVDRVDLVFETTVSGPKRVRLIMRADAYDGPLLVDTQEQFDLVAGLENVGSFSFATAPVPTGSTVTFALEMLGGEGEVYYCVLTSCCGCPVVQTQGTTPPLDQHRRDGVRVRIFGPVETPAETSAWSGLKADYR